MDFHKLSIVITDYAYREDGATWRLAKERFCEGARGRLKSLEANLLRVIGIVSILGLILPGCDAIL